MTDEPSEGFASSEIRLGAGRAGVMLWRNNVGVAPGPIDPRWPGKPGRPIRYGLANDSARLNQVLKSSDNIGIEPGTGRFVAIEAKRVGWTYTGTDRERAQLAFIQTVQRNGGLACFATSWEDVCRAFNWRY